MGPEGTEHHPHLQSGGRKGAGPLEIVRGGGRRRKKEVPLRNRPIKKRSRADSRQGNPQDPPSRKALEGVRRFPKRNFIGWALPVNSPLGDPQSKSGGFESLLTAYRKSQEYRQAQKIPHGSVSPNPAKS